MCVHKKTVKTTRYLIDPHGYSYILMIGYAAYGKSYSEGYHIHPYGKTQTLLVLARHHHHVIKLAGEKDFCLTRDLVTR